MEESETGSKSPSDDNVAEESDSERRRRRRRRRRRKKPKEDNAELQRLLFLARWAAGALMMFATWAYGVYIFSTTNLGFGALIFLPAGIIAMICLSYALAVPFYAVLAMIIGFLYRINSGPVIALQFALVAFVGVGALNGVWRIFVFFMTKREVTRNEAGFK